MAHPPEACIICRKFNRLETLSTSSRPPCLINSPERLAAVSSDTLEGDEILARIAQASHAIIDMLAVTTTQCIYPSNNAKIEQSRKNTSPTTT